MKTVLLVEESDGAARAAVTDLWTLGIQTLRARNLQEAEVLARKYGQRIDAFVVPKALDFSTRHRFGAVLPNAKMVVNNATIEQSRDSHEFAAVHPWHLVEDLERLLSEELASH